MRLRRNRRGDRTQHQTLEPASAVRADHDEIHAVGDDGVCDLIVGAFVAAGGLAGARIDPWTGALAALLIWVAVTGALHLDGLGDIADASGAAHKVRGRLPAVEDRERLLAVLGDPHAGSFAVVAIGLQLIAKLVLLHGLVEARAFAAIALIPFAARIGPLVWSRWLPDLHSGLGSKFRGAVRPIDLGIWTVLLAASALLSPSLFAAPLVFLLWGWWLRRRRYSGGWRCYCCRGPPWRWPRWLPVGRHRCSHWSG